MFFVKIPWFFYCSFFYWWFCLLLLHQTVTWLFSAQNMDIQYAKKNNTEIQRSNQIFRGKDCIIINFSYNESLFFYGLYHMDKGNVPIKRRYLNYKKFANFFMIICGFLQFVSVKKKRNQNKNWKKIPFIVIFIILTMKLTFARIQKLFFNYIVK